ncbi:MAG: DtxR family transcriptional regulator [Actinomycetota bacterium]|nr:DtxR family transcriptional regulator [Actinomycetota bacterium]
MILNESGSESGSLSLALEDYLEAMLNIHDSEKIIRVSDIAKKLNISKASVSQTIAKLKKLGLVNQESYNPVTLTFTGMETAKKIRNRHTLIKRFLTEILDVDSKIAEKDACLMEHVLSRTTINKISELLEKTEKLNDDNYFEKVNINSKEREIMETVKIKTLKELGKGRKGKIVKVTAKSMIRKRFLEMGVTSGSEIEIIGVAPLGDPIEVLIKGYKLSLRKSEAADIFVEEVAG